MEGVLAYTSNDAAIPVSLPSVVASYIFTVFLYGSEECTLAVNATRVFSTVVSTSKILVDPSASSLSDEAVYSPFSLGIESAIVFRDGFFATFSSSKTARFLITSEPVIQWDTPMSAWVRSDTFTALFTVRSLPTPTKPSGTVTVSVGCVLSVGCVVCGRVECVRYFLQRTILCSVRSKSWGHLYEHHDQLLHLRGANHLRTYFP